MFCTRFFYYKCVFANTQLQSVATDESDILAVNGTRYYWGEADRFAKRRTSSPTMQVKELVGGQVRQEADKFATQATEGTTT